MTIAAALAMALLAGGAAPGHPLTGTWEWGSDETGGGVLRVIDDAKGTRFQLQLSRGAPTYNMGFLEGRLLVKDGRATHVRRNERFQCAIAFRFERETVVLTQSSGPDADCGFGHAVYADGTYRRTSRRTPAFTDLPVTTE
jgi:hypothetical protein